MHEREKSVDCKVFRALIVHLRLAKHARFHLPMLSHCTQGDAKATLASRVVASGQKRPGGENGAI
jgi:hypothetical protein